MAQAAAGEQRRLVVLLSCRRPRRRLAPRGLLPSPPSDGPKSPSLPVSSAAIGPRTRPHSSLIPHEEAKWGTRWETWHPAMHLLRLLLLKARRRQEINTANGATVGAAARLPSARPGNQPRTPACEGPSASPNRERWSSDQPTGPASLAILQRK